MKGSVATNAIIAGGGICGLATAIALARRGIDVTVCERRPEFSEEGAGIQIGPNGVRILEELGVAPFLEGKIAVPEALVVHDAASGREFARLPLGGFLAARHGASYWTVHRHDLHLALRTCAANHRRVRLAPATEIVSYTDKADRISVVDAKGDEQTASFLVAADGLWSTLRGRISDSEARPTPIGKTAFRSVTAMRNLPSDLERNAVHIWLAPGAHAVHYPVNDGLDIALVVIADNAPLGEGWNKPATNDSAEAKVKNFAPSLRSLVESAAQWRQWSLYRKPPLPRWTAGRAVLLGDAAHPMLPFLAQGAVMALEDAVTLASCVVASPDDVGLAFRDYEQARRPRVTKVAETAERNGRIYHMSGPAALARNAVMKLRSPTRIMEGVDWLYGWRLKSP